MKLKIASPEPQIGHFRCQSATSKHALGGVPPAAVTVMLPAAWPGQVSVLSPEKEGAGQAGMVMSYWKVQPKELVTSTV